MVEVGRLSLWLSQTQFCRADAFPAALASPHSFRNLTSVQTMCRRSLSLSLSLSLPRLRNLPPLSSLFPTRRAGAHCRGMAWHGMAVAQGRAVSIPIPKESQFRLLFQKNRNSNSLSVLAFFLESIPELLAKRIVK